MTRGRDAVNEDAFVLELAVLVHRTTCILRRHSFLRNVDWVRVCALHDAEQEESKRTLLCKKSILKRQVEAVLNPTARTSFNVHWSEGSRGHIERIEKVTRKRRAA